MKTFRFEFAIITCYRSEWDIIEKWTEIAYEENEKLARQQLKWRLNELRNWGHTVLQVIVTDKQEVRCDG